jgi:ubiquinone/menaquinone biosynthesis C-methylase UbiE
MPKKAHWLAYEDLAWTDMVLDTPTEHKEETEKYIRILKEQANITVKTLLHLGCGAGILDHTFKRHLKVTGVDISNGMLTLAKQLNPEIRYVHGDMRNLKITGQFDAVTIPDSIDYMRTEKELESTIYTIYKYLKPGGSFLVIAHDADRFCNNNFVYTGKNKDVDITVFENNYIPKANSSKYEVTLVYLIRHKDELEIHKDRHFCGLFSLKTWLKLFKTVGFENIKQIPMDHAYDRFVTGESEYCQLILTGNKPL